MSKIHYVKVPENHILIDFDISDKNGNKCLEKNIEAEFNKPGNSVHVHYIYNGDVERLVL